MQQHLERGAFLLFLAAITALFVFLLLPFFSSILWAVVFAVMFYPFTEWLASKLAGHRLVAVLVTLVCVLTLVVIGLFGIGTLLADEAVNLYMRVSSEGASQYLLALEEHPLVQQTLSALGVEKGELRARIVEVGQTASGWLATQMFSIGANAASFALGLCIMLYLTFVFLRNGGEMTDRLKDTLPMDRDKTNYLFQKFTRTVHALFRGTLIVAIAQGAVGGILFALAGVPDAFLWGVVMALFALIPAVGPAIVWVPTALVLFLAGNLVGALAVLIGGVFIIGLIDNILRPILVGRDLEMSDALVMLSILSGIFVFGPNGLVVGPVIASLFLAGWSLYEREYRAH